MTRSVSPVKPRRPRSLSAEQRQRIVDAYVPGTGLNDVAEHCHVHRVTVARALEQAAIEQRQRGLATDLVKEAAHTKYPRRMELLHLRTVVAVAEELHFGRAAARLGVAQSAVSARVVGLENELGVSLFSRTSRSVALTPIGEFFVTRTRSILAEADRLAADVAAMAAPSSSTLRIGIITTGDLLGLPGLLAEYRRMLPDARLLVKPQITPEIIAEVVDGMLDVGFVGLSGTPVPRTLVATRLWSERLVALVPPGHHWEDRPGIHPGELVEEPLIDFPVGTGSRHQSDRLFAAAGVTRTVVAEAHSAESIADLVRGGLGVGIVAAGYGARRPELRSIPIARSPERVVYMVHRAESTAPGLRTFLALVESRIAPSQSDATQRHQEAVRGARNA